MGAGLAPEQMVRVLELQLATERMSWEREKKRRQTWRALAFLFLAAVILGGLVAGYFVLTGAGLR